MNKPNTRIRLVAVDLDGTLLTSANTLAREGSRLLTEAARNDVHVVLATARFPISVRDFCRSLQITGPIICLNGAQVFASPDGPMLASLSFPRRIGLEIACLADANGWETTVTVGETTYYRQRPGQALGPFDTGRVVVPTNSDGVVADPVRILTQDTQAMERIQVLCESKYSRSCTIDLYHRPDGTAWSLGVFPKRANKGAGLRVILRHLGIRRSEALAIGNDYNDIPLFRQAGLSVAMGNAPEVVKQAARVVAPGNDREGVAWALKEFGVSR